MTNNHREKNANLTRWLDTLLNQPEFLSVIGKVKYAETEAKPGDDVEFLQQPEPEPEVKEPEEEETKEEVFIKFIYLFFCCHLVQVKKNGIMCKLSVRLSSLLRYNLTS